jgi:hypothetical protein
MTYRSFIVLGVLAVLSIAGMGKEAVAEGCGKWKTEFSTLAGEGEALNTSYCSEKKGQEFSFEITCSSRSLNIRFMPLFESDGLSFDKVTLDYAVDGRSHAVKTQYEELDGAFAADVSVKDPLIEAMKAGDSGVVTLKDVKAPAYTVPLAGFKRAISKLVRKCN